LEQQEALGIWHTVLQALLLQMQLRLMGVVMIDQPSVSVAHQTHMHSSSSSSIR
jgi:hypothetical protein